MSAQWGGIVLFFLLIVFATSNSYAENKNNVRTTKAQPAKIKILSTIKPLQLLVNGIVGQHAESTVLIPASTSLHHYSLRPSDLRKVNQADIVIRLSANMERFLNPLLQQNKQVVSLSNAANITWLPVRGNHDGKDHNDNDEHHHVAQDASTDYHIWLDPHQAESLANYITQQLSQLDPVNATNYEKNNQQLKQHIRDEHRKAQHILQPLKGSPYLVFHDSWQYLERAYGLAEPHIISLQEGLPPGLKTIYTLRQNIKSEHIHCLIVTPNSNKKLIKTITQGLPIKTIWLNPMGGIGTETSINDYPSFIRHNAEQFSQCISRI